MRRRPGVAAALLWLGLLLGQGGAWARPYADTSPWNRPLPSDPAVHVDSATLVAGIRGPFGCRTDKYSFPVYRVDDRTPRGQILVSGYFSKVDRAGERLQVERAVTVALPLPAEIQPARGRDAHLVIWDPVSGDEWGFWHLRRDAGGWVAQNGYRYNTHWSGVPPQGFVSRGAGVPYLAGLILPEELRAGTIEHAIALGINYPSPLHVYPATKSDGREFKPHYLPMGSRLQLDPALGEADFDRWGLDRAGRIIARALQRYGMILVDGSGHPKLYAEYDGTANWGDLLNADSIRGIPYSALRVLAE